MIGGSKRCFHSQFPRLYGAFRFTGRKSSKIFSGTQYSFLSFNDTTMLISAQGCLLYCFNPHATLYSPRSTVLALQVLVVRLPQSIFRVLLSDKGEQAEEKRSTNFINLLHKPSQAVCEVESRPIDFELPIILEQILCIGTNLLPSFDFLTFAIS